MTTTPDLSPPALRELADTFCTWKLTTVFPDGDPMPIVADDIITTLRAIADERDAPAGGNAGLIERLRGQVMWAQGTFDETFWRPWQEAATALTTLTRETDAALADFMRWMWGPEFTDDDVRDMLNKFHKRDRATLKEQAHD